MTIKEVDDMFIRGPNGHSHPPEARPVTTSKVSKLIKEKAIEDVFRPALETVEEVMLENIDPIMPTASLPCPSKSRLSGKQKAASDQACRARWPDFWNQWEHIPPNFLQYDLSVGDRRHLLYGTQEQLQLLAKEKKDSMLVAQLKLWGVLSRSGC